MPQTVDPRIVILDIDEKSLAEREQGGEGRWPWPRDRLALLMDRLFDRYEIAVLGFDVVVAARDRAQCQSVFRQLKPQLDYDDIFARKIRGRPVVIGYVLLEKDAATLQKKG